MANGRKTGGRKAGTPNKATAQAREAIAQFVEGNLDKFDDWLVKIEKEEGALAAFKCLTSLLEYHIPKMQRMEVTGEEGKDPVHDLMNWIAENNDGGLPNKHQ